MSTVNSSRELHHFLLLTPSEQANAVRRLAATGMAASTISTVTKLHIGQVKKILAEVRA